MYARAADLASYLDRTGSHATKGKKNGRTDLAPQHLDDTAYNSLRTQALIAYLRHRKLQEKINEVADQLKKACDPKERKSLYCKRAALAALFTDSNARFGALRASMRRAGEEAYATTFFYVAQAVLRHELFKRIDEETRDLMGRARHESWENIIEAEALLAQGIVSREAIETAQQAQPEGPEPDGEADAPKEDHR